MFTFDVPEHTQRTSSAPHPNSYFFPNRIHTDAYTNRFEHGLPHSDRDNSPLQNRSISRILFRQKAETTISLVLPLPPGSLRFSHSFLSSKKKKARPCIEVRIWPFHSRLSTGLFPPGLLYQQTGNPRPFGSGVTARTSLIAQDGHYPLPSYPFSGSMSGLSSPPLFNGASAIV